MIVQKIKKLGRLILSLFPTRLPLGVTEFEAWSESFFDIFPMPTQDRDSIKFTLATVIMHLSKTTTHRPKMYFFLVIRAAAIKQVASYAFQDIKNRQVEAAKKAASDAEIAKASGLEK